jgi:hypothetical protein
MAPDLEHIHNQLMEIAKETKEVSQKQYSADDIRHLQNKLHHIDEKYQEGIIEDKDPNNLEDDPYEHQGQAQIASELEQVHQTLHHMLARVG